MSPRQRLEIERWFVRRGVPQLVEGYTSERSMDDRAAPWIAGWIVLGTVTGWGTRADWPLAANVASVGGTLMFVALGYLGVRLVRARVQRTPPATLDLVDIALLGLLPAIAAAVIRWSPIDGAFVLSRVLLGIGAIYLVIAFGLVEIALWAGRRLREQLAGIVRVVGGTLPLLLILVIFLLFTAEIWEAAHSLDGTEVAAILLFVVVVATLLNLAALRPEIRRLEQRTDWDGILADARGTPAAAFSDAVRQPTTPTPQLSWLQRTNIATLVLISQLIHALFVALSVMAFLVTFGFLAVPTAVVERWIGGPVRVGVQVELLGELRTVSIELLVVSTLLSGIVGLYFTGLSLSDSAHRSEHVARTLTEARQLLAARAVYRAALELRAATRVAPVAGTPPRGSA